MKYKVFTVAVLSFFHQIEISKFTFIGIFLFLKCGYYKLPSVTILSFFHKIASINFKFIGIFSLPDEVYKAIITVQGPDTITDSLPSMIATPSVVGSQINKDSFGISNDTPPVVAEIESGDAKEQGFNQEVPVPPEAPAPQPTPAQQELIKKLLEETKPSIDVAMKPQSLGDPKVEVVRKPVVRIHTKSLVLKDKSSKLRNEIRRASASQDYEHMKLKLKKCDGLDRPFADLNGPTRVAGSSDMQVTDSVIQSCDSVPLVSHSMKPLGAMVSEPTAPIISQLVGHGIQSSGGSVGPEAIASNNPPRPTVMPTLYHSKTPIIPHSKPPLPPSVATLASIAHSTIAYNPGMSHYIQSMTPSTPSNHSWVPSSDVNPSIPSVMNAGIHTPNISGNIDAVSHQTMNTPNSQQVNANFPQFVAGNVQVLTPSIQSVPPQFMTEQLEETLPVPQYATPNTQPNIVYASQSASQQYQDSLVHTGQQNQGPQQNSYQHHTGYDALNTSVTSYCTTKTAEPSVNVMIASAGPINPPSQFKDTCETSQVR